MDGADCFAATYAEARDKFLQAARGCDARIEHCVLPGIAGAQGEQLSIDTALVGAPRGRSLLVLTSGTHGVEGFCGSGAQVALLREQALQREAESRGVAMLMLHALNPYGFSHLRRVNEDNVDLNRNFVPEGMPLPENALYAALHPHLLPREWPPSGENQAALAALLQRHGLHVLQEAISAGQYAFPGGLFYGGTKPTWSNRRLREILRKHAASRTALGWIDLHSGLGPSGRGEKIFAGRDDPGDLARARAWWGADVTSAYEGTSSSARTTGSVQLAAYDEFPQMECTAITLEFGTVALLDVLTALRGDHWLHNHPGAPEPKRSAIKAAIRAAFYPDNPQWQEAVVEQSTAAVRQAIEHLGNSR